MTTLVCGEHLYQVTEGDRLWLLRAVAAEGPDESQVAQTLVNCFAYLYSRKPAPHRSLTWLIRAYAQPVNPRWYVSGDLHRKWADPTRTGWRDSRVKALRREHKISARTEFPETVRLAVDGALRFGPYAIPANCTDYAAARIDASRKYRALTPAVPGRNRLWTRAPKWQGYSVRQLGTPRQCGA